MKKALEIQKKIVYANIRYPISVWHTASVQQLDARAAWGDNKLVTLQGYGPGRIPHITRRSLV